MTQTIVHPSMKLFYEWKKYREWIENNIKITQPYMMKFYAWKNF